MSFSIVSVMPMLLLLVSCANGNAYEKVEGLPIAKDTIAFSVMGEPSKGVIIVNDTIDLQGKKCTIPDGITLKIKGGYVKNGTLVGNMTQLKCCRPCFNRVRILGTWNVPVIKSSLFDDLTYDNALQDVVALSHPSVKNKIIVKEGNYQVSALRNNDACVVLNSNTELVLDGNIQMTPNSFRCYNIILAIGENIKIKGKGTVIGDKHTHTGKDGEWGMGIMFNNAHNASVSGLTVKDCWGDCIYVGGNSTDITIEKCKLDHGRRQGISITSANGVFIKNCEITNVSGTSPEFAIDVEPNKNEFVGDVVIDHVKSSNCVGGFKAATIAENARIGFVAVRNCDVSAERQFALRFVNCESALAENNTLNRGDNNQVLICKNVGRLVVKKNTLRYDYSMKEGLRIVARRVTMREPSKVITLIGCENAVIENNIEYK